MQLRQPCIQWPDAEQKVHWSAAEQKTLPAVLLNAAQYPSKADAYAYIILCFFAGTVGWSALSAWRYTDDLYLASLKSQDLTFTAWQTWWHRKRRANLTPQQLEQLERTNSWPTELAEHMGEAVRDLQLVAAQVEEALYVGVQSILPNLLKLCQADMSNSSSSGLKSSQTASSSSSSGRFSDTLSGGFDVHPGAAFQAVLRYICSLSVSPVAHIQLRMEKLSMWDKTAKQHLGAQPLDATAEDGTKAAADVAAA
jgi:hypothetical protein